MEEGGAVAEQDMVEIQFLFHDDDSPRDIDPILFYDPACIGGFRLALDQNIIVDEVAVFAMVAFPRQSQITAYDGAIAQEGVDTSAPAADATDFGGGTIDLPVPEIAEIAVQVIAEFTVCYDMGMEMPGNKKPGVSFEQERLVKAAENQFRILHQFHMNTVKAAQDVDQLLEFQAPLTVLSIMVFGVVLFLFSYAPTSLILLMVLSVFLIAAIELLYQVCYLVAFYNVVMDFEPNRAVLYTVLAFFGLGGVCLMLCRNNVPVGVAGKCGPTQPKYHVHP